MNKYLLHSWPEYDSAPLASINESIETEVKNGIITMTGILQKANTLNQNGRIYPKDILVREVENYQKYILEKRALGELDHPESSVVSLKNVSHNIIETWVDGDVVYGKAQILNTPSGKILQSLMKDKIKLGISSRGVGSTVEDGDYYVVQDDFQLICWDYVSEPSTPGAFMLPESFHARGKLIKNNHISSAKVDEQNNKKYTKQSIIDELLLLNKN
jgi:hypothetical protein